jgi:hypothetical protein
MIMCLSQSSSANVYVGQLYTTFESKHTFHFLHTPQEPQKLPSHTPSKHNTIPHQKRATHVCQKFYQLATISRQPLPHYQLSISEYQSLTLLPPSILPAHSQITSQPSS